MIPLLASAIFVIWLLLITVAIKPDPHVMPVRSVPLMDSILKDYVPEVHLKHLIPYQNHCYRVYNLAIHLLPRKLTAYEEELLAIALAFHDIGIFTDNTADYLVPSETYAVKYMKKHNKNREDTDLVVAIIDNHHKFWPYHSPMPSADLVEAVRQADWIDVMFGLRTFHLERPVIKALRDPFPNGGFHFSLLATLLEWVPFHPTNPFPFFKW